MNQDFNNEKVLVLGLGDTGLSMVRFLAASGRARERCRQPRNPPHATRFHAEYPDMKLHCGPFTPEILDGITLIAISPGVPLATPILQQAIARGDPGGGGYRTVCARHCRSLLASLAQYHRHHRLQRQKHGDGNGRRHVPGGRTENRGGRQYRPARAGRSGAGGTERNA